MKDLDKFKNEMNLSGQNVYVGHRYVPKIMGDWDNSKIYEPLSIVQYQGNSFTSRQYVPSGVEITNEEYWASTGNYNAQVEQYRQDVRDLDNEINNINDEVINARDGEATLNDRLDKEKQKLEIIESDRAISPDDFEGTDLLKVQKAVDEAITSKNAIRLTRMYDLTGGTIMINKVLEDRYPIRFIGEGGGFHKGDSGYMFSTDKTTDGGWTGDIYFDSVRFTGSQGTGTIGLNGDKILRVKFNNCFSNGLDVLVKAAISYLQSYHFNGGTFTHFSGEGFIQTPCSFDLQFGGGMIVEKAETFFTQIPMVTGGYSDVLLNTRISDVTIEGLSGYAFYFKRAQTLKIDGIYFEKNKLGDIHFSNGTYENVKIANIRNYESVAGDKNGVVYMDGVFRETSIEHIYSEMLPAVYSLISTNSRNVSASNLYARSRVDGVITQLPPVYDANNKIKQYKADAVTTTANSVITTDFNGFKRHVTASKGTVAGMSFKMFYFKFQFPLSEKFVFSVVTKDAYLNSSGVTILDDDKNTAVVRIRNEQAEDITSTIYLTALELKE